MLKCTRTVKIYQPHQAISSSYRFAFRHLLFLCTKQMAGAVIFVSVELSAFLITFWSPTLRFNYAIIDHNSSLSNVLHYLSSDLEQTSPACTFLLKGHIQSQNGYQLLSGSQRLLQQLTVFSVQEHQLAMLSGYKRNTHMH